MQKTATILEVTRFELYILYSNTLLSDESRIVFNDPRSTLTEELKDNSHFLLKRFKSNTNHFKCSFTIQICFFSNRKVAVNTEKQGVYTGPCVTIAPDVTAMTKSLASHTYISIGCSCSSSINNLEIKSM